MWRTEVPDLLLLTDLSLTISSLSLPPESSLTTFCLCLSQGDAVFNRLPDSYKRD